jgi:hypothetical protein
MFRTEAEPDVLIAAAHWRDRCLARDGSALTDREEGTAGRLIIA